MRLGTIDEQGLRAQTRSLAHFYCSLELKENRGVKRYVKEEDSDPSLPLQ